jgi:hypothetical protein
MNIIINAVEPTFTRKNSFHTQKDENKSPIILKGADFETIKSNLGKLYLPTYLPDGFDLSWTQLAKEHSVCLNFYDKILKSRLIIMESMKSAELKCAGGKYSTITIGNNSGYLIKGAWVTYSHKNTIVTWSENIQLEIIFNLDDWLILLAGAPSKLWNETELIRIAESLKAY